MKLKKLLALTLAGAMLTASLTACTPLDAAELVYDSIFGGGSSSTGSTGSTAEEAENRAFAEAYVQHMQSVGSAYAKITPVYDIPHLEEFVKAIDEYCTKNGGDWEYTVQHLSEVDMNRLAQVLVRHGENYGNSRASLRFWKDPSGNPQQQVQQMNSYASICNPFWYTAQQTPYHGDAWFDSVVLTRANGSKYRFLLSICHN